MISMSIIGYIAVGVFSGLAGMLLMAWMMGKLISC